MGRFLIALICVVLSTGVTADGPQDAMGQYFQILNNRNYETIGSLMAAEDMNQLQELMVNAIRKQVRVGRYDIQKRVFGKKVSMKVIKETTADFYIGQLAKEILTAADTQHLVVDGQEVLGRFNETAEMVHFLVRVHMTQGETSASNIRVYTLVKEGEIWKMKFPDIIKQLLQVIEVSATQRFGS
ncbi:MAG: hypothetical protein VB957_04355 [Pseudomonadales bacterium]|jgi:hypothetical protein